MDWEFDTDQKLTYNNPVFIEQCKRKNVNFDELNTGWVDQHTLNKVPDEPDEDEENDEDEDFDELDDYTRRKHSREERAHHMELDDDISLKFGKDRPRDRFKDRPNDRSKDSDRPSMNKDSKDKEPSKSKEVTKPEFNVEELNRLFKEETKNEHNDSISHTDQITHNEHNEHDEHDHDYDESSRHHHEYSSRDNSTEASNRSSSHSMTSNNRSTREKVAEAFNTVNSDNKVRIKLNIDKTSQNNSQTQPKTTIKLNIKKKE